MPHRSSFVGFIPFAPLVVGAYVSTWRFRAGDGVGGLAFGLAGVIAMLVIASWIFRSAEPE